MSEILENLTLTLNSNNTCNNSQCFSHTVMLSTEYLTIVFAVLGFVGNLLTVLAIVTSNLKHNINSILIGNLSGAQIIYCACILPLQALIFHHRSWPLNSWVCVVNSAIRIWLIGVNMMLLSAIAFYRFLHIVHPQIHGKFSRQGPFLAVVVLCWIFPVFFSMSPIVNLWGSFSFNSIILQCTFTQLENKSHKITTITLGFVIPCIFIIVCYARIGCVAYTSKKRIQSGVSQTQKLKSQKGSLRLTAMMLCIFCLFLIGTAPYFAINILDPKFKNPMVHIWAPFMAWFMYCMNPVIYTVMDQNFQNAFRRLLFCEVCKKGNCFVGNSYQSGETSYAQR